MINACPECFAVQAESFEHCMTCGWEPRAIGKLLDVFSAKDRQGLADYTEHYEALAEQDLSTSVLSRAYLEAQAGRALDLLGRIQGMRGLEVGVGQGFLLQEAERRGAQMAGIDVARSYLQSVHSRTRAQLFLGSGERLPFLGSFDFITATDVFEHVLNPGAFLYSVNRALRIGGRLVLRVPYRENVLTYAPQYGCKIPYAHLRSFNGPLLRDLLGHAGLKTEQMLLDGFSLGIPQPWMSGGETRLSRLYLRLQQWLQHTGRDNPANIARLPTWLARLAMRPTEICVLARKVGNLVKDVNGNVAIQHA
jgi:SAM-dependent methyltransferase